MTKTFDPTKPVQLRNGLKAEIVYRKHNNNAPLVVITTDVTGFKVMNQYKLDGHRLDDLHHVPLLDLVNIPKNHTIWINIYPECYNINIFETKFQADLAAARSRIACIEIKFEEGEGLDDG